MARRRAKNLFLAPEVVKRAERFCEMAGTNLSQLVEDFLGTLPREGAVVRLRSPLVERLLRARHDRMIDGSDAFAAYVSRHRRRLEDRGDAF